MRVKITLACTECKQRNYNTMKNKKNDPDRLEMNKYCRFCRKHTVHKEKCNRWLNLPKSPISFSVGHAPSRICAAR